MTPLVLKEETLGDKHRHYNGLVKAAAEDETYVLEEINYEDEDATNLLKVEVAMARRDAVYTLRVLRGGDALLVARALRRGAWLLADAHAHLLRPEHLHTHLFPHLNTRTKNKLLLFIRLNLKDAKRVEGYFNYFKDNFDFAQKWLLHCSLDFIENVVMEHGNKIKPHLKARLCKKSLKILKYYIERHDVNPINPPSYLVQDQFQELVEISNKRYYDSNVKLNKRLTKLWLRQDPDEIINNFAKYHRNVHMNAFTKYMRMKDITGFLLKLKEDETHNFFTFDNIKPFILNIPEKKRFPFVKDMFLKKDDEELSATHSKFQRLYEAFDTSSHHLIYRWYEFASFDVAFNELRNMIRHEASPLKRNAILTILLHCSRRDPINVQSLLEYYRDNHINEPLELKSQFLKSVLSNISLSKLDKATWHTLNVIYSSMELDLDPINNFPFYVVPSMIVYKVIHDVNIPENLETKVNFNNFGGLLNNLDNKEQEKVFTYLCNLAITKFHKKAMCNIDDMRVTINNMKSIINLSKCFENKNRSIMYPSIIIEGIKKITKVTKQNSWKINLSELYNIQKPIRRQLFEDSLMLYWSDEVLVNALKHDPGLLSRHNIEVAANSSHDTLSLKCTLRKLRTYWPQTKAQEWADMYFECLQKLPDSKAAVEGLCILLPRKQAIPLLINKYAPAEAKIDWDADSQNINVRKNIAKYMYLVRPPIDLDVLLLYAKGDYMKYALPSLNSFLNHTVHKTISENLLKLLGRRDPLPKYAIVLALSIFKCGDFYLLKELIAPKTLLVKKTFHLLIKEKVQPVAIKLWRLLDFFIDKLSYEEKEIMYLTMKNVYKLPQCVRPMFVTKVYTFLVSTPQRALTEASNGIKSSLKQEIEMCFYQLEPDFIENIVLKSYFDDLFKYDGHNTTNILALHLLNSKTEEIQNQRYTKVLDPVLERCCTLWQNKKQYNVKNWFQSFLRKFGENVKLCVIARKCVVPDKLYKNMKTKIEASLPLENSFPEVVALNLQVIFLECLRDHIKTNNHDIEGRGPEKNEEYYTAIWCNICSKIAPSFGQKCYKYVKTMLSNSSPLFYYVSVVINGLFLTFLLEDKPKLVVLRTMLSVSDINDTAIYCLVIDLMRLINDYGNVDVLHLKKEVCDIIEANSLEEVNLHYYTNYLRLDGSSYIEETSN